MPPWVRVSVSPLTDRGASAGRIVTPDAGASAAASRDDAADPDVFAAVGFAAAGGVALVRLVLAPLFAGPLPASAAPDAPPLVRAFGRMVGTSAPAAPLASRAASAAASRAAASSALARPA